MNRTIPFVTNVMCDFCGILGAYDFMGDYLCEKCFRENEDVDLYDDEHEELDDEDYCSCIECRYDINND